MPSARTAADYLVTGRGGEAGTAPAYNGAMAVGAIGTTAERLRRSGIAEAVRRERAVAIMRRLPAAAVDRTVEALLAAGFRTIEFTWDSDDAAGAVARWRADGRARVGAGTIRRAEDVDAAVEAGAEFLVAPTYQEPVVERALELGVPSVPGALSPTEIDSAWLQGATFVKLFPGGVAGPAYVRAVLNPLKDVELVVTGGVDAATARSFLDTGAVAVGVSTAQLGQPATADGDFGALETGARTLLAALG
jgi:2-dehydro-3-deoxyphosphogluconate aldolase/(4S)-4-hydroxy-2-oxoglutarate aldolase